MNKKMFALALAVLTMWLSSCATAQSNAPAVTVLPTSGVTASAVVPAPAGDTTVKVVAAAEAFLATLDSAKRAQVMFDFNNNTQRANWSNLPLPMVTRKGVKMGDMNETQRKAALSLLATVLSQKGYQQAIDTMNADEVLKTTEGNSGNLQFGKDLYWISLLGAPSTTTPWLLQFGGHHLAINATVVGENITLTPSLPAAQPVSYTLDGKAVRLMGVMNDKAFALINGLDATQQKQAILSSKVIDLVLGPGQDGKTLQAEGIKATTLTPAQQTLLLEVAGEFVTLLNDEDAALKMAEVKANLADTYFVWYGPTTNGSAAYFRITGPTLLIEYSPQAMGGSALNHTHAIYRDPTNDYGAKWLKK